ESRQTRFCDRPSIRSAQPPHPLRSARSSRRFSTCRCRTEIPRRSEMPPQWQYLRRVELALRESCARWGHPGSHCEEHAEAQALSQATKKPRLQQRGKRHSLHSSQSVCSPAQCDDRSLGGSSVPKLWSSVGAEAPVRRVAKRVVQGMRLNQAV